MTALLLVSTLAVGQTMTIVPGYERKYHVEVQDEKEYYLVHFFVNASRLSGRDGVVNLRSVQPATSVGPKVHLAAKKFHIGGADEFWEFYLATPKFPGASPKVVFQVDVGVEPQRPRIDGNLYEIGVSTLDSRTWRFEDGKIVELLRPQDRLLVQSYILDSITNQIILRTAPATVAALAPAKEAPDAVAGARPDPDVVEIIARRIEPKSDVHIRLVAYQPPQGSGKSQIGVVDNLKPQEGNLTLHRYSPPEVASVSPPNAPAKSAP